MSVFKIQSKFDIDIFSVLVLILKFHDHLFNMLDIVAKCTFICKDNLVQKNTALIYVKFMHVTKHITCIIHFNFCLHILAKACE